MSRESPSGSSQDQTPSAASVPTDCIARARLGERSAARSGLHDSRANAEIRLTYSGPTARPLPARGGIVFRTADLREPRHKFTRKRFAFSSSSGLSGSRFRWTENDSEKPVLSASNQLSMDRTGTRKPIRDGTPCAKRRRTRSGAQPSRSRSRSISQLIRAADRISPGSRWSSFGAPPATIARCGIRPACRINRSATGISASPSTAK